MPSLLVARLLILPSVRYKRYKLGDVKSFDSLFFPEKAKLIKILENFENKTGEKVRQRGVTRAGLREGFKPIFAIPKASLSRSSAVAPRF